MDVDTLVVITTVLGFATGVLFMWCVSMRARDVELDREFERGYDQAKADMYSKIGAIINEYDEIVPNNSNHNRRWDF